jgi:hypothetical protein
MRTPFPVKRFAFAATFVALLAPLSFSPDGGIISSSVALCAQGANCCEQYGSYCGKELNSIYITNGCDEEVD